MRMRSKSRAQLAAIVLVLGSLAGCGEKRLVEVFDNGPARGPQVASEGYVWVGEQDLPPPGKTWAPVDPDTLTPEQKKQIRK